MVDFLDDDQMFVLNVWSMLFGGLVNLALTKMWPFTSCQLPIKWEGCNISL